MNIHRIKSDVIMERILCAIDHGVTTAEIRADPLKYLVDGTKEIIINAGGSGICISPAIAEEMIKRGECDKSLHVFKKYSSYYVQSDMQYTTVSNRENPILIQIIKEGVMCNNGGMALQVMEVYNDPALYTVQEERDVLGSEYIDGWHRLVAEIPGNIRDMMIV
jgi:hypothetical protein